jgi:ATP-dependent helicase HrpA
MRHEAAGITTAQFPHELQMAGRSFALEYHHEPGSPKDGVTLTAPLLALNQIDAARSDWLVPGLAREKITRLAKSLPQKLRHPLGPLPEFVDAFLAVNEAQDAPLAQAIARYARREHNLAIPPDAFRTEMLPAHLSMNFRVVDEHGRQLGMGRNLAQLRAELGQKAQEQFSEIARADVPSAEYTGWEFGDLEEVMEIRRGSQTLIGYPGLVDKRSSVSLDVFDSADRAHEAQRAGLRRLFMLQLREQARHIERNLPGLQAMAVQFAALGGAAELKEQLLAAAFDRACMQEPWPRIRAEFERRRDEARSRVTLLAQEIARLVGAILAEHAALQRKLQQSAKAFPDPCRDIEGAVAGLMSGRFIEQTPYERLQHFPRYLKAAGLRVDKLRADPAREERVSRDFAALARPFERETASMRKSGTSDPALEEFRWLLEELRVALFAQELRTPSPVSVKRLQKAWENRLRH